MFRSVARSTTFTVQAVGATPTMMRYHQNYAVPVLRLGCNVASDMNYQKRRLHSTGMADSTLESTVPIIDMSMSDEELGKSIHHACTTVGFFIIVQHGVPEELRARMLQQARLLFSELTLEEKEAISVKHSNSYRGFQTMGVNVTNGQRDGHEALDLVSESTRAIVTRSSDSKFKDLTNYGQNQWPDPRLLPDFRNTTEEYIEAMQAVGLRLMSACSRGLGLDPYFFEPYFDDAYWSMRMIRYPVDSEDRMGNYDFGVGEHTDYGVFTMILCDDVKGTLQIRRKGQSEWTNVDPVPNGFICNLGDMLARWSNNLYVSTPHRVLRPQKSNCHPLQNDRISIPFFFDPNYDSVISPIGELVEKSKNPLLFDPIMYGDHLLAKTSKNFMV
ncbi:2-oxyglutarate/Fe(II) oxygenase [Nitzschia inconspicua]|uniref:2-oxyglutarate/Fe(II) oxygenase n=1 Tax=Nitzschia inconspicua TaxID=303405 RepID=A0A9K3LCJ8_9STRA|nr:2-oxyglutarate/Fe(II) oxygenase [Nitzschia inconspicua]